MKISIISVGEKPAKWCELAQNHYYPLVNRYYKCELIHLKSARASNKQAAQEIKALEATSILKKIDAELSGKTKTIITLDERGSSWTTQDFAKKLTIWEQNGNELIFVIGGTEGLDNKVKNISHQMLALSGFTLPHQMARVILLEQLFRAASLINNHPYHRE